MAIESIAAKPEILLTAAELPIQTEPAAVAPETDGKEFANLLRSLEGGPQASQPPAALEASRIPQIEGAEGFGVQETKAASEAASVKPMHFLDQAEAGFERLNELLRKIHREGPFSLQELMGLQLEVYKITLQLETTTKAVAEAVNDTRQLMQQQL